MGKTLIIKDADFSANRVAKVKVPFTGGWTLGRYENYDTLKADASGGVFIDQYQTYFGQSFGSGVDFFEGKKFTKVIQNTVDATVPMVYGYCDVDGSNFVEVCSVSVKKDTVTALPTPIVVPAGKVLSYKSTGSYNQLHNVYNTSPSYELVDEVLRGYNYTPGNGHDLNAYPLIDFYAEPI